MQAKHSELTTQELTEQLHLIVDEMLKPFGKSSPRQRHLNALADPFPPIDITKPNAHDTKAEFQYELNVVEKCVEHLRDTVHALAPKSDDLNQVALVDRLRPIVDQKFREQASRSEVRDARSLALNNVAITGAYNTSLYVLLELWTSLNVRLQELRDQEERFWNIKHRAPDYYARTIAIRLAKLFAREVGKKPGYGVAAITGDPSTSFSRALKKTYKLLGIKAGVRTHAEYAVAQITDADMSPVVNTLAEMLTSGPGLKPQSGIMGGLLGLPDGSG